MGDDDDCGCFDVGGRLGMGPCPIHDHAEPAARPALIVDASCATPPAPRQPVTGWVETEPGLWELDAGYLVGVVDARGTAGAYAHGPKWWIAGGDAVRCTECGDRDAVLVEGDSAPDVASAKCAAEDAIHGVIDKAAAALQAAP